MIWKEENIRNKIIEAVSIIAAARWSDFVLNHIKLFLKIEIYGRYNTKRGAYEIW